MRASQLDQTPPCQIVTTYDNTAPPAAMEDLWTKICELLAHQHAIHRDEAAVQSQQQGMIRDGCFIMPSPSPDQSEDICTRSWFHEYQFFFEFRMRDDEQYFWISGQLDRGYALDTIWFPARAVAVTNFAPSVNAPQLARFSSVLLQSPAKPVFSHAPFLTPRVAVLGFQHLMHMLWNQLPALDRLAGKPLPDTFKLAVQCEPFGPTTLLYPEFASIIHPVRNEDMGDENARSGLVLGLGSWTITSNTQDRVRRVASAEVSSDVIERRDRFTATHHPVFWLSVKPPPRTMSQQSETLVNLIEALAADYKDAGFVLDGASLPWDYPGNSNYPPWFHAVIDKAVQGSSEIIDAVLENLDGGVRPHVQALNNVSACEEVVWGESADFYICHGGTMQNKIGWIHRVPGFIHSNRTFLRFNRVMSPVSDGPACFYASDALIVDDDPGKYSALELARKDQDYSFTSIAALISEVRDAVGLLGIA